jgi:hypothetical protein
MAIRFLFIYLVLSSSFAFAQKTRTQRCAPASSPRQKYIPQVARYAEIEVGLKKAFMYKYEGRFDDPYSFVSGPGTYACISYNLNLFRRFEAYAGAELFFSKPGLRFRYKGGNSMATDRVYHGIQGLRVLAGISCVVLPGWKLTAAPSLIFSSNWQYSTSGSFSSAGAGNNGITGYRATWSDPGFHDRLYPGIDLKTEHQLFRNVYLDAGCSVELGSSVPLGATTELSFIDGRTQVYEISAKPYIVHANAGLSFRFLQRGNY